MRNTKSLLLLKAMPRITRKRAKKRKIKQMRHLRAKLHRKVFNQKL